MSSHDIGVGIDFGTSHTVTVLSRENGRVEPLLFESSPLLPSAVFADPGGELVVGRDAQESARSRPSLLEPHPKRRVDDSSVLLGDRDIPVPQLFAAVLSRVRRECVQVLGAVPERVTLTHPAAWGPRRRLLLQDAAELAGFPQAQLISEPVAAATYFVDRLGHQVDRDETVVVHDFGGGTFDASAVRRTATGFEVLSVDGLEGLGGVDIDAAIVTHLRNTVGDADAWQRLMSPSTPGQRRDWRMFTDDVRGAKERLSRQSTADLYVPVIDADVHLTRAELERLAKPLLAQAVDIVDAVIRDAGVARDGVCRLLLVGGASRMPLVATMLHQGLSIAPTVSDQLEQIVAHGAILATKPAGAAVPALESAPASVPGPRLPEVPQENREAATEVVKGVAAVPALVPDNWEPEDPDPAPPSEDSQPTPEAAPASTTAGRTRGRLGKGVVWSSLGMAVPLAFALAAVSGELSLTSPGGGQLLGFGLSYLFSLVALTVGGVYLTRRFQGWRYRWSLLPGLWVFAHLFVFVAVNGG